MNRRGWQHRRCCTKYESCGDQSFGRIQKESLAERGTAGETIGRGRFEYYENVNVHLEAEVQRRTPVAKLSTQLGGRLGVRVATRSGKEQPRLLQSEHQSLPKFWA